MEAPRGGDAALHCRFGLSIWQVLIVSSRVLYCREKGCLFVIFRTRTSNDVCKGKQVSRGVGLCTLFLLSAMHSCILQCGEASPLPSIFCFTDPRQQVRAIRLLRMVPSARLECGTSPRQIRVPGHPGWWKEEGKEEKAALSRHMVSACGGEGSGCRVGCLTGGGGMSPPAMLATGFFPAVTQ